MLVFFFCFKLTAFVDNPNATELQTVVNEPIYNAISYFISYIYHLNYKKNHY